MASQTDHEENQAALPGIPEVMAAITTCQTALTSKVEAVQLDAGLLRQDLDKIRSRITVVEQLVGEVEDTVTDHEASIRALQTKVSGIGCGKSKPKEQPLYCRSPGGGRGAQSHCLYRRPAKIHTSSGPALTLLYGGEGPPSTAEAGTGGSTLIHLFYVY